MEIDYKKILSRYGGLLVSVFIGLSYAVSLAYKRGFMNYFGVDFVDLLSADMVRFAIETFIMLCLLTIEVFVVWVLTYSEKSSRWRTLIFDILILATFILIPPFIYKVDIFREMDTVSLIMLSLFYVVWVFARRAEDESPLWRKITVVASGATFLFFFFLYIFSLGYNLGEQEAAIGSKYMLISEAHTDKYLLIGEYKDGFIVLPVIDIDKNVLSRNFKIMSSSEINDYTFEKTPKNYSFTMQ